MFKIKLTQLDLCYYTKEYQTKSEILEVESKLEMLHPNADLEIIQLNSTQNKNKRNLNLSLDPLLYNLISTYSIKNKMTPYEYVEQLINNTTLGALEAIKPKLRVA